MEDTKIGQSVTIHGAVGAIAPIAAMALLLSARSTLVTALILLVFVVIAVLVGLMPRAIGRLVPWGHRALLAGYGAMNQTVLCLIVLILAVLMAVTTIFELDVVLGRFAAGFILNATVPDESHDGLETALNVMFYSLLILVFFVASGIKIDWQVIRENALAVAAVPLIILVTRGLPVFLRENSHRGDEKLSARERLEVALYAATGLLIIVAVTSLAQSTGLLDQETTSIFDAGGALTVAVFPLLARLLSTQSNA